MEVIRATQSGRLRQPNAREVKKRRKLVEGSETEINYPRGRMHGGRNQRAVASCYDQRRGINPCKASKRKWGKEEGKANDVVQLIPAGKRDVATNPRSEGRTDAPSGEREVLTQGQ